jgi:hypothetical protein
MRHNVVEKVLPRMISEHWRRIGFARRPDITAIRTLCREIDLLHPQVDDNGRRGDNVEYPWTGVSGDAIPPASWRFPLAARLNSPTGRLLTKAAVALTRQPKIFVGAVSRGQAAVCERPDEREQPPRTLRVAVSPKQSPFCRVGALALAWPMSPFALR